MQALGATSIPDFTFVLHARAENESGLLLYFDVTRAPAYNLTTNEFQ